MAVLKIALIALMVVAVAVASDVETEVEADSDAEVDRPPRKGRKLVSPRVIHGRPMMRREHIVIVPKGDPRARGPANAFPHHNHHHNHRHSAFPTSPATPAAAPVMLRSGAPANSAACAAKAGKCGDAAACKGSLFRGVCPGTSVCCIGGAAPATKPVAPTPSAPVDPNTCPLGYATQPLRAMTGNNKVVYQTVPIRQTDLSTPSEFGAADTVADNTMRLNPTGCAFARMADAAAKAGIKLTIASGFRTVARQQYLYNCYLTKRCNNGNLAAYPGTSNHGEGLALDLNTDCGGQSGSRAPSACHNSKVYMWLLNNYKTTGFIRTVQVEPWHWEYRPGQALPAWAK